MDQQDTSKGEKMGCFFPLSDFIRGYLFLRNAGR